MEPAIKRLLSDARIVRLAEVIPNLHVVGGTLRDLLLGMEGKDIDLACSLEPEEMAKTLATAGIQSYQTGLKHQTLTVLPIEGEPHVEITTFRAGGMRPNNRISVGDTITQDLLFRDFTINAMALEVATASLIDPSHGHDDVRNKLVRAVGDAAERFEEDPLRMMRMIRFAVTLDFQIEPSTFAAASARAEAISKISIERVRDELTKILISPQPDRGLRMLANTGLLREFLPEVEAYRNFEQNEFHKADLFTHTVEVLSKVPPDPISRLAALFHDVAKPHTLSVDEDGRRHFYKHEHVGAHVTEEILERLKYPKQTTRGVCTLVKTHMRPLSAGAGGVRRLLRDTGEHFERWRKLKYADATSCKIHADEIEMQFREFDSVLAVVQAEPDVSPLANLAVSGKDLLELGFREGPKLGDVLEALHEEVLDDPSKNNKDYLLKAAAEALARIVD